MIHMRIALLASQFPPHHTDGIARQGFWLAQGLAKLGVEVHVITTSGEVEPEELAGLTIHSVPQNGDQRSYSAVHRNLNSHLARSLQLFETLMALHSRDPFDLVNYPLWLGEGLATSQFFPAKTVVNVQTTILQILELQNRRPYPHQRLLAAIDRRVLESSDGIVADSFSIRTEIARLYDFDWRNSLNTVIHLGIPPLSGGESPTSEGAAKEILIPGRLEQRKGTREIFKLIPRLLDGLPGSTIRFVGRDNSMGDGFHAEQGLTYPEYFRRHYPQAAERVLFSGHVSDEALSSHYSRACCVLFPSHYESFGLTYLEAMRAGKAIIALDTGAAREIFAGRESDGAILVPPNDETALLKAVARVVDTPNVSQQLGASASERFNNSFTAERMASETLAFFERVVRGGMGTRRKTGRRIFQMMEALQPRDAVSNITREMATILHSWGEQKEILALFCSPELAGEVQRLQEFVPRSGDAVIAHYWIYNWSINYVRNFKGRRAIFFHNVTPAHYFPRRSMTFEMCARSYVQIPRIAEEFDLILGDSDFDVREFSKFSERTLPTMAIYPSFSPSHLREHRFDRDLLRSLRGDDQTTFLFVGRISPNKRQDRLIHFFADYLRRCNANSKLYLVGDAKGVPEYASQLRDLVSQLRLEDSVVITGSVSQESLYSYYRGADFFVCSSEHEGFCLPLIEAMAFSIPVLALDTSAVAETMGDAGVLLREWEHFAIADQIERIRKDGKLRKALIRKQHENIERFNETDRRNRLAAACQFLRTGEDHPLFTWRKHGRCVRRPERP